jgi:hypothetical protein
LIVIGLPQSKIPAGHHPYRWVPAGPRQRRSNARRPHGSTYADFGDCGNRQALMHKELGLSGLQPPNMMWCAVTILPVFTIAFHLRMLEENPPIDLAQLGQIVEKSSVVQGRVYVGKNESVTAIVDRLCLCNEMNDVIQLQSGTLPLLIV